jgi:hypothetical protein
MHREKASNWEFGASDPVAAPDRVGVPAAFGELPGAVVDGLLHAAASRIRAIVAARA